MKQLPTAPRNFPRHTPLQQLQHHFRAQRKKGGEQGEEPHVAGALVFGRQRGGERRVKFEDMPGEGEQALAPRPAGNRRPAEDPQNKGGGKVEEPRVAGSDLVFQGRGDRQRRVEAAGVGGLRREILDAGGRELLREKDEREREEEAKARGQAAEGRRPAAADRRPAALAPTLAAAQGQLMAEGVMSLTLKLLKSLKDNRSTDSQLMKMCEDVIKETKDHCHGMQGNYDQKLILQQFQTRDNHGNNILDYCRTYNKPELLTLIISAIPDLESEQQSIARFIQRAQQDLRPAARNQRPAADPRRAAEGPRPAEAPTPAAEDPRPAAAQGRLEAEEAMESTLKLLKSLKDNRSNDYELMEMCQGVVEQINQENHSISQEFTQELILSAFQERDEDGKSILDYCAIHNKPELLALIISAIPNIEGASAFTTGDLEQSPYTHAVVNNSLEFLESLFDTNIPIKEMTGGRNIFHVLLSNLGLFYQKSIYELSDEEIDKKLKIAQLLLNKADPQLLNAGDNAGLTPIHYLYRYGSPKFISRFNDMIVTNEVYCSIRAEQKSIQIFNQIIDMDLAGSPIPNKNSRIIDLIKLESDLSEKVLRRLLQVKGRPYFDIVDRSGKSLSDLIQQDDELATSYAAIISQGVGARNPSIVSNPITPGALNNENIWDGWKGFSSQDFGIMVEATTDVNTFFTKRIGEMSIFQHTIIDKRPELAKIIIDKIDNLQLVEEVEKSFSDRLFLSNLTDPGVTRAFSDVAGFLREKKDSLTPASCTSCFTSLFSAGHTRN